MGETRTAGRWDCFVGNANGRGLIRIEAAGLHIASLTRGAENEANALYICEAVNAHDALVAQVASLREALTQCADALEGYADERQAAAEAARAALAEVTK